MIKVGILTFHFSDNYGALFQAYALKSFFEHNGCDVNFIDYHPDYIEDGGFSWSNPFSRGNVKALYLAASGIYNKLVTPACYQYSMDKFRSTYLDVGSKKFKEGSSVDEMLKGYDLVVCGSDQIWNPSIQYGVDPVYFFGGSTSLTRKISYAPSFGSGAVDGIYHKKISDLLEGLDAISIREESGADFIENIIGRRPVVVPDPTILNPDFSRIYEEHDVTKSDEPYAFLYYLRTNEGIPEASRYIEDEFGCKIYEVHNPHRRWSGSGEILYPSPGQWLYLLRNSEIVLTNSFHGVALSIVNNKRFVYMSIKGSRSKMNARAFNLLKATGLEANIAYSLEDVQRILTSSIDWVSVNKKVAAMQNVGVGYLNDQIESVKTSF